MTDLTALIADYKANKAQKELAGKKIKLQQAQREEERKFQRLWDAAKASLILPNGQNIVDGLGMVRIKTTYTNFPESVFSYTLGYQRGRHCLELTDVEEGFNSGKIFRAEINEMEEGNKQNLKRERIDTANISTLMNLLIYIEEKESERQIQETKKREQELQDEADKAARDAFIEETSKRMQPYLDKREAIKAEIKAENEQLRLLTENFILEVDKIAEEAKANQWKWKEGKTITLYKWDWCKGGYTDDGEKPKFDYDGGWSISDRPDASGYIHLLPETSSCFSGTTTNKGRQIKLLENSLPTVSKKSFSSIEDLPKVLKYQEFKDIQYWETEELEVLENVENQGTSYFGKFLHTVYKPVYSIRIAWDADEYCALNIPDDSTRTWTEETKSRGLDFVPTEEVRRLVDAEIAIDDLEELSAALSKERYETTQQTIALLSDQLRQCKNMLRALGGRFDED